MKDLHSLLSLELSSNNANNILFTKFLVGLPNLIPIKDMCNISINFNGNITLKEQQEAKKIITNLGFQVFTKYQVYSKKKGQLPMLKMREDAHQISPYNNLYSCLLDDDILFLKGYANDLLLLVYKMLLSGFNLSHLRRSSFFDRERNTLKIDPFLVISDIAGGLIIKNNINNKGYLTPKKFHKYYGIGEDLFIADNYKFINGNSYSYYSTNFEHNGNINFIGKNGQRYEGCVDLYTYLEIGKYIQQLQNSCHQKDFFVLQGERINNINIEYLKNNILNLLKESE